MRSPQPTLNASPLASGAWPARMFASTTLSMYVKSRDCVPSPWTSSGCPRIAQQDEARDHRRVLGLRVLARPEHVEVAEPDRLDAVEPASTRARTARSPPSTPRTARSAPAAGPRASAAPGCRRRPTTTTRTRRAARRARRAASSTLQRAGHVVLVGAERIVARSAAPTAWPPGGRSRRDAAHGALDRREIAEVALDHLEPSPAPLRRTRGSSAARGEVVEDANALARRASSRSTSGIR